MPPSTKSTKTAANASLARRLLFPTTPEQPLLLTGVPPELNDELYDFLALALRAFVLPWWGKLTRFDKEFLPEITRVVIQVVHALETRARDADLSTLVLRTIPTILARHYADFHLAHARRGTSYAGAADDSLARTFHALQPHIALTPDGTGALRTEYLREAVERVLALVLPPQDYASQAEREIVREIFVKVLLADVFPRVVQPWFIQKQVLELLGPPRAPPQRPVFQNGFSFHALVVLFLSAVQAISTACLAAISISQRAWHGFATLHSASANAPTVPGSTTAAIATAGEVFTLRSRFASAVVMSFLEMGSVFVAPYYDRYAPYMLYDRVFTADFLHKVLVLGKKMLFPNGYPGPPPIDPTPEEQAVIRESLEIRLAGLLPESLAKVLIGQDMPSRRQTIKCAIDPLGSVPCNNHLLVFILDALLLTLFPEMGLDGASLSAPAIFETPATTPVDGTP
ncbi:PXA domain-containing protein [Auriculariales sp. MPI-PUGE-AT-0066]|nr:PXA domain-containing protein [Auriculariales sp. MPI-PUGE-AT-0066]